MKSQSALPDTQSIEKRLQEAIQLAVHHVRNAGGGPFGCVIYKNGVKISEGVNRVTHQNDPTAHAEIEAIRAACRVLGSWQLDDCEVYASSEPCPMCMAALYWARPRAVYFANPKNVASANGFDDSFIYTELNLPAQNRSLIFRQIPIADAAQPFTEWKNNPDSIAY
ncbi:MAG: nucleoside deaminase [Flavobacteriales bacterium]|nr:nucleoside deaminase [Flavobacteriales bacterium]